MKEDGNPFPEPVRIPVNGELDLHTFSPKDLGELLPSYLEACREAGIFEVRIVHGKGRGVLRETVHAFLRKSPLVKSYTLGDERSGSWGVTRAVLLPLKG